MSTSARDARSCVATSRPRPEESTNGTSPRSSTSSRGLSASTRSSTGSKAKVADMSRSPASVRSTPSPLAVSSMVNRGITVEPSRSAPPSTGTPSGEPGLLEVQIALDETLDVGPQAAVVAQPEQRVALHADQLAPQVGVAPAGRADVRGAVLVAAAEDGLAGAEARAVELAHAPQLLLARRALVLELVDPIQRGLRGLQARDRLVGRPRALALEVEDAQQG